MKQRINLYRGKPEKSALKLDIKSLSGSTLLVAAVSLVALVIGLGLTFFDGKQQDRLAELRTEKNRIESEVQTLQDKFSTRTVSQNILDEKTRLESEITSRKQLMSLLYQIEPANSVRFSSFMFSLAEASQPESWLTVFTLDANTHSFTVEGEAVAGPAVPELFGALGKTEAFQGLSVVSLSVAATETGVSFTADTELQIND